MFDATVDVEFMTAANYFGHIQDAADGGAGVTLNNLDGLGSPGASDFMISLEFRIDTVETNRRMFNLMVNGDSSSPTATGSAVNLRYFNDTWQAYNGSAWTGLALPSITPNTWHSLTLTGSNWGTGVAGTSQYEVTLNGTTTLGGLQIFQNNTDLKLARSIAFNDRWDGATNGFDIDNLLIEATVAAAPPPNTTSIIPTAPVAYSGIYAHTAVTNCERRPKSAALGGGSMVGLKVQRLARSSGLGGDRAFFDALHPLRGLNQGVHRHGFMGSSTTLRVGRGPQQTRGLPGVWSELADDAEDAGSPRAAGVSAG